MLINPRGSYTHCVHDADWSRALYISMRRCKSPRFCRCVGFSNSLQWLASLHVLTSRCSCVLYVVRRGSRTSVYTSRPSCARHRWRSNWRAGTALRFPASTPFLGRRCWGWRSFTSISSFTSTSRYANTVDIMMVHELVFFCWQLPSTARCLSVYGSVHVISRPCTEHPALIRV